MRTDDLVGLVGLFVQGLYKTELPVDPPSLCASWMHSGGSSHTRWLRSNYRKESAHIVWSWACDLSAAQLEVESEPENVKVPSNVCEDVPP